MLCALYDRHGSAPWQSFVLVTQKFPRNRKAENYHKLVEDVLSKFKDLGVKISVTVHYVFSHLDHFPTNLGDLSEELGERFHQDIYVMEEKHQGRWNAHMMVDYCWSLQPDCLAASRRQLLVNTGWPKSRWTVVKIGLYLN